MTVRTVRPMTKHNTRPDGVGMSHTRLAIYSTVPIAYRFFRELCEHILLI